ncbi:PKD domain-containing protein, partial [Frankia sp. R82]|uniref:PKD domain-containing protein n=1 Tax=Frankia sp. R82 TaxID=2950553 RepID=UPI0020441B50
TTTDSAVPVQVSGLDEVTALAGRWSSAYALRRDGTVRAWGTNYHGQLGNGTTTDSSTPVQVDGLDDVSTIGAGDAAGYAVRRDGTAWSWGSNHNGGLGDGTTTDSFTPIRIAVPAAVTAVVGGSGFAYALGGPARQQRDIPPTARLSVIPVVGSAPSVALVDAAGSAPGSAPLASYTFDFGDGTLVGPGTDTTATHLYHDPGTHQVTLTVTDNTGATTQRTATTRLAGPGQTGPGISWEPGGDTPRGCNHCAGVRVTSTGTDPLAIDSVTPAPNSRVYPNNDCPATLPVGDSCTIWWVDTGGRPGQNTDIIIRHNAPGGVTIV